MFVWLSVYFQKYADEARQILHKLCPFMQHESINFIITFIIYEITYFFSLKKTAMMIFEIEFLSLETRASYYRRNCLCHLTLES